MWLTKGWPDWLAGLQLLLVGVLVVAPLWALGRVAYQLGNDRIGSTVKAEALVEQLSGGQLSPGTRIQPGSQVEVVLDQPSIGQTVGWWVLTWLPTFALFMVVVAMLRSLVRRARADDPFTLVTVRRLRMLAVVTVLGTIAARFVEYGARFGLNYSVLRSSDTGQTFEVLSGPALLAGLAFVVLAEVFKRGCAMRAELETVI